VHSISVFLLSIESFIAYFTAVLAVCFCASTLHKHLCTLSTHTCTWRMEHW
jgi:hypothetical protein